MLRKVGRDGFRGWPIRWCSPHLCPNTWSMYTIVMSTYYQNLQWRPWKSVRVGFQAWGIDLCYSLLCPMTSLYYTIRKSRQNETYSDNHESWWGWVFEYGESNGAIRIYVLWLLFTKPYVNQDRRRLAVTHLKLGEDGFSNTGNRMVLSTSMSHHLISLYYTEIKAKQNLQWQAWNSVRVGFQWRQIWWCDPQQCYATWFHYTNTEIRSNRKHQIQGWKFM
jgi:hypothetical protein